MAVQGEKQSLILKEQAELETAPYLFSENDLPKIDKARPKFHCTGERLFRDKPHIYKAVVRLLAEPGVSIRTICGECNVSDHTIRSVAAREGIPIATVKREVLANVTHGMRLASERVIELMPEASARDALIGVGILGDKMSLLSGDPTARIEIGPPIDFAQRFQQLHDELARQFRLRNEAMEQIKRLEARLNGLDGENAVQKALRDDGIRQLNELKRAFAPKALMNGENQRPGDDGNGARDAVVDVDATLIADESGSNADEVV